MSSNDSGGRTECGKQSRFPVTLMIPIHAELAAPQKVKLSFKNP
jgi:hypothetical protein